MLGDINAFLSPAKQYNNDKIITLICSHNLVISNHDIVPGMG